MTVLSPRFFIPILPITAVIHGREAERDDN
jgi:hypothetical protein